MELRSLGLNDLDAKKGSYPLVNRTIGLKAKVGIPIMSALSSGNVKSFSPKG